MRKIKTIFLSATRTHSIYTEIVARVAKYKLNCVANGAFDVERTTALTKIGFAFKYYFRRETRKAKMRCPTGREINS